MKILMPVAGRGRRTQGRAAGLPKCLVLAAQRELLLWALESIHHQPEDLVVVYHESQRDAVVPALARLRPQATLVEQQHDLRGAADTVYCAAPHIAAADQVAIIDCDFFADSAFQWPGWSRRPIDGSILTVRSDDPAKSFVTEAAGWITEIREKEPISSDAVAGIYHFSYPRDLLWALETQFAAGLRTNGEFFVSGAMQFYLTRRPRVEMVRATRFVDLGETEKIGRFEAVVRADGAQRERTDKELT
ncbi:MAG TPA: NTP transferase domain-containing protein [Vicinamibacterales bacterium]|nr:NTP transferase domain-containing protein [Vicinamibacterales bacterium]